MATFGKTLAYRSSSPGTAVPTHNFTEAAYVATTSFSSGDMVTLDANGAVVFGTAATNASGVTVVATTSYIVGTALRDSITSTTTSNATSVPVALAFPTTQYLLNVGSGTAATTNAATPGVSYALGYGSLTGSSSTGLAFYVNLAQTYAVTSVATAACVTVMEVDAGAGSGEINNRAWCRLGPAIAHPIVR